MKVQHEFKQYAVKHLGMNGHQLEKWLADNTRQMPKIEGFTPTVVEERQLNAVSMDVFSRLMMDRIIFIGLGIDAYVANVVQAQLLFLDSLDSNRDISIYINSPGGSVIDGLGIYDTMQYVRPDVSTICTSMAASMSAVLLASGAKGKRVALPHSRIMIHQTSGGMQGQLAEMKITYELFKTLQHELFEILSEKTGQSVAQINKDCDRDHWMTAKEALEYGLIDEVVGLPK